ncbi:MAG: 3-oxoacid CoA-transferase subunit A [Lachnospiraceae bacterium]|nr:3-oxoacid CoA-transferase subunit A [Lachnospiraceae bacterium]MBQ1399416.1 3-oxoacid CoA-transferase subunit A [Lachnospiraceae bacterium]MBQ1516563.1 3-oxoacid CoA-transferase subunit A [Lachnospiraceae bacterium]MBQ3400583.1 3-oxoacid CoA-transferase subunit A [Lachnospiraceae bacterium]MBQ4308255.1 3-oxoacid CoA-transferase subunit A [Lachnospiraceae bacterium]
MHNKVVTVEEAMTHCFNGMSVLLPGFVNCGVAQTLIQGLMDAGITDLTVISNNTSVKGQGIGKLVHDDRIKKITCSHIGSNVETMEKVTKGEINIHFVPQGSLCEKVRAGGAGIGGILTPTGVHTPMEEGKQLLEWDDEKGEYKFVKADEPQKGKRFILELPLHADVALIHAYKADKMGNVMYNHTARNFNEVFATAADFVIVEAEHIVEVGEIGPNEVMTPGALVDLIVQAKTEV